MKVLMMNRSNTFNVMGGDTIQMLETKKELEKQGVEVSICTDLDCSMQSCDVVHIFNIMNAYESYMQFQNAKSQGKPIVVSTIYQSKKLLNRYYTEGFYGHSKIEKFIAVNEDLMNKVKNLNWIKRFPKLILKKYKDFQRYIIEEADIILPNSKEELNFIKNELSNNYKNSVIVVNGVSKDYLDCEDYQEGCKPYNNEKYIFCPGRIEPLKNQINIMKAMQGTGIKIVFAGQKNLKHKKYIDEFDRLIRKNKCYSYIGQVNISDIKKLYKNAEVTALCSWFETTGLVALEGGVLGCNIVITSNGYTREYFKDWVSYCDPASAESIKNGLIEQFYRTKNTQLSQHIKNHYTWEKAADATLKAYKAAIKGSKR